MSIVVDLGLKAIDAFKDSPQAQEARQAQIQPLLDQRRQACIDLWREFWAWVDGRARAESGALAQQERAVRDGTVSAENGSELANAPYRAASDVEELGRLSGVVDRFVLENGALVSARSFYALIEVQHLLRQGAASDDDLVTLAVSRQLMAKMLPAKKRDNKGRETDDIEPGVLLRLRDEIGANARAASSTL